MNIYSATAIVSVAVCVNSARLSRSCVEIYHRYLKTSQTTKENAFISMLIVYNLGEMSQIYRKDILPKQITPLSNRREFI